MWCQTINVTIKPCMKVKDEWNPKPSSIFYHFPSVLCVKNLKVIQSDGRTFLSLNPLRPSNDVSQTSHCNIKGVSVSEVMRIENMITQVQCY